MANEVTLTAPSLAYADSEGADEILTLAEKQASVSSKKYIKAKQSIGFAAEEAINLGEVTAPGWAFFINRDTTNFIELRVATSGAKFAKLLAGEPAGPFRLGSGAQAPYAIADTAACVLEYMIINT